MPRNQRHLLLGLAGIVVIVAIVVAATSGGGDSVQSAGPTTIRVRDAKPVGGVRSLTYKKGKDIDLTIKSDTADEVHFHGYDVHKDVEKGGSVRFNLPATIEGSFVVELEEHGQTLANVKVEP